MAENFNLEKMENKTLIRSVLDFFLHQFPAQVSYAIRGTLNDC